ncbi:MAG: hypothetical protein J6X18_04775 [Bacteroidales bacterium]|nr:hypothetical protein [Bacteroidales bacterium]
MNKENNYSDNVGFAELFIEKVHAGQTDKAGKPYFLHPKRVEEHLFDVINPNKRLRSLCLNDYTAYWFAAVALLHDTVEDTWVTEDLLRKLFDDNIANSVMILTRRDGESYDDFIERIASSGDTIAIVVKIADLNDNMNLGRLDDVTEKDIERTKKYARAKNRLMCALEEIALPF